MFHVKPFVLNGDIWTPVRVAPDDPRLVDRTGVLRIATTDPATRCVYLSKALRGADLERVLTHEVGHCAMVSFGLLGHLHSIVPEDSWVAVEEWACNFIANYGRGIMHAVKEATGVHFGRIWAI